MDFALVHGSWAGAWCWDRLTPELEARGHRVVAMDLPCDDPTATFEMYADVVVRALEAAHVGEVVVVGHSPGGLTIPLVAARRPVSRLIYLCALVPIPGHSFAEQLEIEPDTLLPEYQAGLSERDDQGRTRWIDGGVARAVLFADCDEGDARAASSDCARRRTRPSSSRARSTRFPRRPAPTLSAPRIGSSTPTGQERWCTSASMPSWSSFPGVTHRSFHAQASWPRSCTNAPRSRLNRAPSAPLSGALFEGDTAARVSPIGPPRTGTTVDARARRAALRARRNPGRPAGSRRTSPRQTLTPGQREQFERVRGSVKRLVDVTPLVGVAVDGAVHFVTGLGEQKARNLEHNRDVALTTGANAWRKGMDVVVEGTAERVTEREALQRVADAYDAKYGGDLALRGRRRRLPPRRGHRRGRLPDRAREDPRLREGATRPDDVPVRLTPPTGRGPAGRIGR